MNKFLSLLFLVVFIFTNGTLIVLDQFGWVKNEIPPLVTMESGLLVLFMGFYFLVFPLTGYFKLPLGYVFLIISTAQFILAALWAMLLTKTEFLIPFKGTKIIFAGSYFSYLAIEALLFVMHSLKTQKS